MPIPSRSHARLCLLALGVSAYVLMPAWARAEGPSEQESVQSSWRPTPPTLSLQPEAARVFLRVPPEWLPPSNRRLDPFARDQRAMFLPEWTLRWSCHATPHSTVCRSVAPLGLGFESRPRLAFAITVLPRAAVAMLRFDPIPPRLR